MSNSNVMPTRPLTLSLALILTTAVAGLFIRFATFGLPPTISKYGGSALWALMIYWLVSTLRPTSNVPAAAMASCLLATAVEFFKLYHSPRLDAFRLTLPGILLLGRFFSLWDILAYYLAILAGAVADTILRSDAAHPSPTG